MVLGEDDFTQEFVYLSGRDQWLARDLLGYGTVCGLRLTVDATSQGPRVAVEPGTAVSPQGQMIRVTLAQCAYLNNWLAANKQAVIDRLGALPGGMVTLYVVLCYRDCPTDQVPIPGEPCRSEDDMMAPSRLKDDFTLELRFTPPDQREEDALRDFVAWLSQIDISSGPSTVTLDEFITTSARQFAIECTTRLGPRFYVRLTPDIAPPQYCRCLDLSACRLPSLGHPFAAEMATTLLGQMVWLRRRLKRQSPASRGRMCAARCAACAPHGCWAGC